MWPWGPLLEIFAIITKYLKLWNLYIYIDLAVS